MTHRNTPYIPRRAILAGMGASAAGMFLRPMFASAADAPPPARLLIVHRPCGTRPENFFPQGGDAKNFTLGSITKAFEPLRENMVILSGIKCPRDGGWSGDQHAAGLITMMTGKRFIGIPGTTNIDSDPNAKNLVANDKSIDQLLLEKSALLNGGVKRVPVDSLQSTAFRQSSVGLPAFRVMSYSKSNGPLFPESRAQTQFDQLFGSTGAGLTPDVLARLRAQKKGVLDFVNADLQRLRGHVPKSQYDKLDAHLSSFQSLERSVATYGASPGANATNKPTLLSYPAASGDQLKDDEAQHLAGARNHLNIISAAFQADLTRVATFSFSHGNSPLRFKNIINSGITDGGGHHDISHGHTDTIFESQGRIDQTYCEILAEFLLGMKAIKEGSGTLLDNTLVVFFSEVGIGDTHSTDQIPLVMFGGQNAGLKQRLQTGTHQRFNGRWMNDVWTSVANAFDVPMTTYGDSKYAAGSAAGLFG